MHGIMGEVYYHNVISEKSALKITFFLLFSLDEYYGYNIIISCVSNMINLGRKKHLPFLSPSCTLGFAETKEDGLTKTAHVSDFTKRVLNANDLFFRLLFSRRTKNVVTMMESL